MNSAFGIHSFDEVLSVIFSMHCVRTGDNKKQKTKKKQCPCLKRVYVSAMGWGTGCMCKVITTDDMWQFS